jgi:hypothetical protein
MAWVLGLLQDTALKSEEAQLAVEVEGGIAKIGWIGRVCA